MPPSAAQLVGWAAIFSRCEKCLFFFCYEVDTIVLDMFVPPEKGGQEGLVLCDICNMVSSSWILFFSPSLRGVLPVPKTILLW